jgi:hypothetical protein
MSFKHHNIVGQLINFRGLVYAPVEENGVIFLFAKLNKDLDLNIETIRKGFPDCIAKRYIGKNRWEEVFIEFEYKSSDFVRHKHLEDMRKHGTKCDIIVCWEHDWKDCPKEIEVVELQTEYKKYLDEDRVISDKTNKTESDSEVITLNDLFKDYTKAKKFYAKLEVAIKNNIGGLKRTIAKSGVFYYSPEKVFCIVKFQKKGLRLRLFTSGKSIKNVDPVTQDGNYAQKWGQFYIESISDLTSAIKAIKKSHELMKQAVAKNENTGWYAEVE